MILSRKNTDISQYPAVYAHLLKHYDKLSKKGGGNEWHVLQASPTDHLIDLFRGEKLIWKDIADIGHFSYFDEPMYCVNSAYIAAGGPIKYLCAVLNSRLIAMYMNNTATDLGENATRWFRKFVEQIPVPYPTASQEEKLTDLVDAILDAKATDRSADVSAQEDEIDALVYALFGLTEEEIRVVEARYAP